MSIDEAIECERNHRLYPEYHEEIAEWLEELKEIKSNGRYVQGNKAGQKIGYRNAIDDFVKSIEEECGYDADINDDCYFEISRATLLQLAEQLKAGETE